MHTRFYAYFVRMINLLGGLESCVFLHGLGRAFLFSGGNGMGFAENLKAARKESGLTQQELADKLEMNRSSFSKYENGEGFPRTETLLKICEMLEVSLDSLFRD